MSEASLVQIHREAITAAGVPFTTKPDVLGGFSRG